VSPGPYISQFWTLSHDFTAPPAARANCKYSFPELEKTVMDAMDSVSLTTIRRFAMRSKRWMMAYINGLTEEQRAYAEKQYKSHRRETRRIFV
jgi:hypothetical protein